MNDTEIQRTQFYFFQENNAQIQRFEYLNKNNINTKQLLSVNKIDNFNPK